MAEAINSSHDPFGPLNRARDQRFCPGTRARFVKVFGVFQMPCDKNAGHNGQDSLATFVHWAIVAYSPFVRLQMTGRNAVQRKDLPEAAFV